MELFTFFQQFPSLGDLATFLLATHMIYAGVGKMPSPERVGQQIFKLKKGGYKGMIKVLISPGADEQTTVNTFCQALQALNSQLRTEEKFK